ncbi:hypothetical protein D9M73_65950 [compost metagenome]|nr:MAG TPA: hypothetical protein [Caudoviricetes sp.]
MKSLKRILISFALFSPLYLMWKWIGPALWSHQSTGAFDAFVALWFIAISLAVFGILLIASIFQNRQPRSQAKRSQPVINS